MTDRERIYKNKLLDFALTHYNFSTSERKRFIKWAVFEGLTSSVPKGEQADNPTRRDYFLHYSATKVACNTDISKGVAYSVLTMLHEQAEDGTPPFFIRLNTKAYQLNPEILTMI